MKLRKSSMPDGIPWPNVLYDVYHEDRIDLWRVVVVKPLRHHVAFDSEGLSSVQRGTISGTTLQSPAIWMALRVVR